MVRRVGCGQGDRTTVGRLPPAPDSADPEAGGQQHFADMVDYTDGLVGRIEDGLTELGLRENTVVVFATDNGTGRGIRSRVGGVRRMGSPCSGSQKRMAPSVYPPLLTSSFPSGDQATHSTRLTWP